MSIQIQCPNTKCRSDYGLKNKTCPNCGAPSKKAKKFRIQVVNPEGSRITKIIDGSLTLAREIESKLKSEVITKQHLGVSKSISLREAWEKYLQWMNSHHKKTSSDVYRWKKFLLPLGSKKMSTVTAIEVQELLNKARRDGYSPQSIKHILTLLKRIYNWSIKMELYHGRNPVQHIKAPRVNNKVTACLTIEQVDNFIQILDTWNNRSAALLTKFALYTGFRLSDCMNLRWDDVVVSKDFVTLRDPKGLPATIPISKNAKSILTQAENLVESEFVFPNKHGKQRVSFHKIWSNLRKAAELPKNFRFHDLRHTFASYLASSGKVDLYTLQKLLNHQSPQMTQRYAHLLDEALQRGANVADEVFDNTSIKTKPF
jgi:integrase